MLLDPDSRLDLVCTDLLLGNHTDPERRFAGLAAVVTTENEADTSAVKQPFVDRSRGLTDAIIVDAASRGEHDWRSVLEQQSALAIVRDERGGRAVRSESNRRRDMPFAITPQPATTPWGIAHNATQILPGIWKVSTPSHGGMILSDERQAAMPKALGRGSAAYEEDVDWSLVVLAFEAEFRSSALRFSPHHVDLARQIVRTWHSERFTAHTGEPVPPNESPILRRRAAALAAVGELVTTSAFGDWAYWVPEGQVGVVARRIAGVCALGFPATARSVSGGLSPRKRTQPGLR